jgi:hypothetical protein
MHHQISFVEQEGGKWRASCSCGPEGVFNSKKDAQDYMGFHAGKLGVAFGVNTVGWSERALMTPENGPVEPEQKEKAAEA